MGKYSKAITNSKKPNNPLEQGKPIKEKKRCYYCNEDCTGDFIRLHQGKKIRIVCGTCNRGTKL